MHFHRSSFSSTRGPDPSIDHVESAKFTAQVPPRGRQLSAHSRRRRTNFASLRGRATSPICQLMRIRLPAYISFSILQTRLLRTSASRLISPNAIRNTLSLAAAVVALSLTRLSSAPGAAPVALSNSNPLLMAPIGFIRSWQIRVDINAARSIS